MIDSTLPAELRVLGPRPLTGRLRVPGDKSLSHRALMLAAVARGRSRLRGLADGADVASTGAIVRALGVRVRETSDGDTIVQGLGYEGLHEAPAPLDCGNSGTTIRIMTGLLAGRPILSVLYGDESIAQRPMARVVEPLRAMGAHVDARDGGRLPPIVVRGGALRGITHETPVASAQVKSALLLAGLQADGETVLREPALSRDHTERMLAALGAPLRRDGLEVRIRAAELPAFDYEVAGDPSAAAFFIVGASITPGSDLTVESVCLNPTRIAFLDVLTRMGAAIEVEQTGEQLGEPIGTIRVRPAPLTGAVMEGAEIPLIQDEIPALAVAAAFAEGTTEIRDAAELRLKESDRIGTIQQELSQLGIVVETTADSLTIRGGRPRAALLKSHGDHRIAMACAIAANACADASDVRGWRAVASSYPRFAVDLASVTGG